MNNKFNTDLFTNITKNICTCTALSIFIIMLFIISPFSYFFKTSMFMKVIALIIMIYTIYLNAKQINLLRETSITSTNEKIQSQLNMNIICSYIFTIFIGLLIIFVVKSFF
jgi:hypothetical protein